MYKVKSNARRGERGFTSDKEIAEHQKLSAYGFRREMIRREAPLKDDKWTDKGEERQGVDEGDKAKERVSQEIDSKPEGLAEAGTEFGSQCNQIMGTSLEAIMFNSTPKGFKPRPTDRVYRCNQLSTQLEGIRHQTPTAAITTEEDSDNPVPKPKSEEQESDY